MRCKNCGKENEDIAKFCVSCGSNLGCCSETFADDSGEASGSSCGSAESDEYSEYTLSKPYDIMYQEYQEVNGSFDVPRRKRRRGFKTAVIAASVIIALSALFCIYKAVDYHSSPTRVVYKYIDLAENRDTMGMLKTMPVQYQKLIKDNFSYFDSMSSRYLSDSNDDIDVECRIISKTKIEGEELKARIDNINNFLSENSKDNKSYGKIRCRKAYKIKVSVAQKGDIVSAPSTRNVIVYRINGRWFIDPSSI